MAVASWVIVGQLAVADVTYNQDVLPILANKCFRCHGADSAARQASLRLDRRDDALKRRDGSAAIVAGKPDQSELLRRIEANDDTKMPPAESQLSLTKAEKQILRQWIADGAIYETHWAFQLPVKSKPPTSQWGNNEIDAFIHSRLKQAGLKPQQPASKEELLRRVSFDLNGLPPTLEELDNFLADKTDTAFDRVVDRLLKSPRYGERMAMWWLDGAHYGDSHGYDNDLENSQWPWRNWVIQSFNDNKPFDEFTIEQLAGDLLADPTESQILATAFNRNHRIQTEGGAIDEEWRTEYVIDRVETMGAVWMGLTLGCCRCHDHKFDPISQREFYQLFALFNNLDEKGFINNLRGAAEPRMRYQSDQYEQAASKIKQLEDKKKREQALKSLDQKFPTVMIMRDMTTPRKSFILQRGQYDAPGAEVLPGLPRTLPHVPDREKITRLTLARWLVDGKHPLTARVLVNRIWEQLFGTGIVESTENMGLQADRPSHPKLLDWLAVNLVESGWDVKALLRKIVSSTTYQQSHVVDADRLRLDPLNRLLSRGPRVRLLAEMIRDQALAVSGLLHEQLGGPSVRPYQPAGLWEEVEKRGTYVQDHGTDLYRRTLYTAIRKTVVTPELIMFDMPSRETCTIRRSRTNTPLQALQLMNNVTYVEAAKHFAQKMMVHGKDSQARLSWGFRRVTMRRVSDYERRVLLAGYNRRLAHFKANPESAQKLLEQGESKVSDKWPTAELAAMTTVANLLLNLDEVINK